MSVRNILDGTIKVGSGEVMPVEPEIPENLTLKSLSADRVETSSISTVGIKANEVTASSY